MKKNTIQTITTSVLILMLVTLLSAAVGSTADYNSGSIQDYWYKGLEPFSADGFINPEVCNRCHKDIHSMWDGSMHTYSFKDPIFRAASKAFVEAAEDSGVIADAEHCVACHNPIAYRSGTVKGSSDDYENANDVMMQGISCDLCHSVTEAVRIENAMINAEPGEGEDNPGTKRGPRDDPQPYYHEAEYSELHRSSEFCGSCHNVTHLYYLTKLEGTYDEWYHSPYNHVDREKRVVCQDCHMRQTPGNPATGMTERPDYPGRAAEMGGKERPHIYRHNVVGGNMFIPMMFGNPEKAEMAKERLQHAATMEIAEIAKDASGKITGVTIRVRNEGAGHMLPTGVTEYRQMWLRMRVVNADGEIVYESGVLDDAGIIPEDAHIFNTVFGDENGEPTFNVSKAAMMLRDHRIHPKGFCDEVFSFGEAFDGALTMQCELLYRSFDPPLLESLIGETDHEIPIVTMTDLTETLE